MNMIWLDYKKAYDSVPHAWIIEALKLAKIPDNIIAMIQNLISKWQTELNVPTINGNIRIGEIWYKKGVFQGDYLSVILFILSLNPLSFLLNETDGYKMAINTIYEKILTHLFFVDDLKLYAATLQQRKLQLDIVTTFSHDIGMAFGEDKCGYVCIERGKKKSLGKSIIMNGVTIRELEEGEPCRYLGQDETIGYDGKLNKDRVRSEYFRRVKKIWTSELIARNKISAHNTFALPVLVPTIGILDWTLAEIDELDKRTRKILCMTGNFHRNSDKDRLYVSRKEGDRGLKSFEENYTTRMITLRRHIMKEKVNNHYLESVELNEKGRILRIGEEFERLHLGEEAEDIDQGKKEGQCAKENIKEQNKENWLKKQQHGYLVKQAMSSQDIDIQLTNESLKDAKFSSHKILVCHTRTRN